jgi:hypothetical protein
MFEKPRGRHQRRREAPAAACHCWAQLAPKDRTERLPAARRSYLDLWSCFSLYPNKPKRANKAYSPYSAGALSVEPRDPSKPKNPRKPSMFSFIIASFRILIHEISSRCQLRPTPRSAAALHRLRRQLHLVVRRLADYSSRFQTSRNTRVFPWNAMGWLLSVRWSP